MALVNELGKITFVNAQTERLFRFTRNELLGQSIELLVPERFRSGHPEMRDSFNAAPQAREMGAGRDLNGRRKDGSQVSIEIGLNPIKMAGKDFTLAAITDITERKAAAERLNLVVEASPSAILLVNEHGRITLVNLQAEKLFEYRRSELVGQLIELLVPERVRHAHLGLRDSFNAAPHSREMGAGRDLYGRRKDGSEVPIEIGLSPITSAGEVFTLAAITDITERKAAEELRLVHIQAQSEGERIWSAAFQRAVLPASLPRVRGCFLDAVYQPGLGNVRAGGDWYDAVHLLDGRILVSIGDVCGGGLEAAVVVGVARQVNRSCMRTRRSFWTPPIAHFVPNIRASMYPPGSASSI
jgi:PAS domain S-box-containing protein